MKFTKLIILICILTGCSSPGTAHRSTPLKEGFPIAEVVVVKATLRDSPSKDGIPVMTVSKGTRLTVEIPQGDWYQVITPTGIRAWAVQADLNIVDFLPISEKVQENGKW